MTGRGGEQMPENDYVGYALQVQVNSGQPSAYWKFDDEYGGVRSVLAAATADREEAVDDGFLEEDLRIVALTVVAAPGGEGAEPCANCWDANPRCLYFACTERQEGRHTTWWCDYGCCGSAHAVEHYGEDCLDA